MRTFVGAGRAVYSTITTASAPAGSAAPVMISTHWPAAICPANSRPGGASPMTVRETGASLVAPATSAARTAKPSRVTRGNGG